MSWLFSRALVAEYSEGNCSAGAPYVLLKPTDMLQAFSWPDKMTVASRRSPSGMTFEHLTGPLGRELLMWYLGGFPCQDISVAGKGAGLEGERSGLWREFARIVCEVRPRYIFVENSPALTSRGLGCVLKDLAKMGYNAEWCVLGARDAGAWHKRERIWIAAYTNSLWELQPQGGEWFMGWPIGWTELNVSVMGRFQQWQRSHGTPLCTKYKADNIGGKMSHAEKSPSAASRWGACPGSIRYIQTLPEKLQNPTNPEADKGTAAHFLLETCLKAPAEPSRFLGQRILVKEGKDSRFVQRVAKSDSANAHEVTAEMVRAVQEALDYIKARKPECTGVFTERKVNALPDREDTFGKADNILDGWPILEVIDYKNGRGVVEATSPQLQSYLAGAMHMFGQGYDAYRATVIQPHALHEDGHVRSKDYTEAEMLAWIEDYRGKVERVDIATQEFDMFPLKDWQKRYLRAGDHCQFCPCSGICPAKFDATMSAFTDDVPEDPQGHFPEHKLTEVDGIERAKLLYRNAALIKKHLQDAEDFLKAAIEDPTIEVPGASLEPGRGKNEWLAGLTEAQLVTLCAKYGLTKKELFRSKIVTGPQALALVASDKADEFKAELLEYTKGALKVVLK
jgi:site-specific DNA-cytosine methylase